MQKLDALVMDQLVAELPQPDRLRAALSSLRTLRAERAAEVGTWVKSLHAEISTVEDKLNQLYAMVE